MSLSLGGLAWELLARWNGSPFFPSLAATLRALWELVQDGLILGNVAVSLTNLVLGFAAAIGVGIAIGVSMARVPQIEMVLEPYLHALLAAPGIVYVPLLFTVFGATRPTQIGSVFLHAVFVIVATTAEALKTRNAGLMAMASAFGASEPQTFWRIRWPAARPLVVNGVRVGALLAVKGMVNGEMFIAYTGLGALIRTYGARFEVDKLLAIVMVIAIVAVGCSVILDTTQQKTYQKML